MVLSKMGIIKNFMNKCLSVARLGAEWLNKFVVGVVEAARTISYVETTTPSQADSAHKAMKETDKRWYMRSFEELVKKGLPRLQLGKVKIAIDVTEDSTWAKHNLAFTRPSAYDDHLPSWQFVNVSIVDPHFIPLMSVPYTMLDDLDSLVIDLLEYVRTLPLNVELVLFDRGFYHAHLIDYLESRRGKRPWPYLMLVPQTSKVKEYIEHTDTFGVFVHEFKYPKKKSNWKTKTTIMVHRIDEETSWIFATNQEPTLLLMGKYKKRWNIETGFRIHDEARIKSKSVDFRIRFFTILLA